MRGRDPEAVMADLGFGELQLVTSFSVSMSGTRCRDLRQLLVILLGPSLWRLPVLPFLNLCEQRPSQVVCKPLVLCNQINMSPENTWWKTPGR